MNKDRTIEEIEGIEWGEPDFESYVVLESHRLRKIPLSELTIENFRFLIGQQMALDHLIPIALDILEVNPLAEGEMYAGDLLNNVTQIDKEFWVKNPLLHDRVVEIKIELEIISNTIIKELLPNLKDFQFK